MTSYSEIISAIESSVILEPEQKMLIIGVLEKGPPFPEEMEFVVKDFVAASVEMGKLEYEILHDQLNEIDEEIEHRSDPEELQKRADFVIQTTEEFLRESKKLEGEYEKEVEAIIHDKAESSEIDDIRAKLMQPKK